MTSLALLPENATTYAMGASLMQPFSTSCALLATKIHLVKGEYAGCMRAADIVIASPRFSHAHSTSQGDGLVQTRHLAQCQGSQRSKSTSSIYFPGEWGPGTSENDVTDLSTMPVRGSTCTQLPDSADPQYTSAQQRPSRPRRDRAHIDPASRLIRQYHIYLTDDN